MTKMPLSVVLGALAIAAHAGSASAQEQGRDAATGVARSAADLTCNDLVSMDNESVRNLLYYVAGYAARASADLQADSTSDVPRAPDNAGAAVAPTHSLATTGSDNTTGAATSGTTSESAAVSDEPRASSAKITAETGASDSTEVPAARDARAPTSVGPNDRLPPIGGFRIDVEQALTHCEAAPETRLTDVLDQQALSDN